jgi:hypothetical protein
MELIIGIAIGAVLTFIGSYFLFVLQRKQKVLAYSWLSLVLLIPLETKEGDNLQVLVRSELLRDHALNSPEYVPAGRVYGLRILLQNRGAEIIENQVVTVDVGEDATVINTEFEESPYEFDGEALVQLDSKPWLAGCSLPYLSPKEAVILSVQCASDDPPKCTVRARAPGLIVRDLDKTASRIAIGIGVGAILSVVALIVGITCGLIVYGVNSTFSEILHDGIRGPIITGLQTAPLGLLFLINLLLLLVGKRRTRFRMADAIRDSLTRMHIRGPLE